MDRTAYLAEQVAEQARDLPEESLLELARFIDYLRFKTRTQELHRERLATDYAELSSMYEELREELADEIWLPLENEALLKAEGDVE
jgi:hypothetical protein